MTESLVSDYSKAQDLDKQKQAQNEQLNNLLDQNDLIRKKLPDGPNSLLRAVSDALYSTPHYVEEIQQFLFKHLKHLIATDKLPSRLTMFKGNTMLIKDYTSMPHMAGFDKINLELVSSQFKRKIIVYHASDDNYLSSFIVNNHYERTIEIVRTKNNHYEPVYSKLFTQKMGVAQNIVLNLIERALNKDAAVPFKNINEDSYINYEYLNWLSTIASDKNLSQFRITRGKHKKSFSDSFGKPFETTEGDQMKVYNMFTNTKPPEAFLNLLRPRKDTAESNHSINADFNFMDEPWHETPTDPTKNAPFTTATTTGPARSPFIKLESPYKTQVNRPPVQYFVEENRSDKTPVRDTAGLPPLHFLNTPPPGLTPNRYPQKMFFVGESNYPIAGSNNEIPLASPGFQRPNSQTGDYIDQATPTRQGLSPSPFSQYPNASPMNRLADRRGQAPLILSVNPNEGMMQQGVGSAIDPGAMSASKEKKKPIILDESKERYAGRLKFFDEAKNYGFITMDGDGSDIFVHMDDLMKANITKDILKDTKNGVVLRFAFSCMKYIGKGGKSRKATDIELLQ